MEVGDEFSAMSASDDPVGAVSSVADAFWKKFRPLLGLNALSLFRIRYVTVLRFNAWDVDGQGRHLGNKFIFYITKVGSQRFQ